MRFIHGSVMLISSGAVGAQLTIRIPSRPQRVASVGQQLRNAAYRGNCVEATRLLDGGAQPDSFSANGLTPLIGAVYGNQPEMVALLIMRDADVNCAKPCGCTPLDCAVRRGNATIVTMLLQAGANANSDEGMHASLPMAFSRGHATIVKELISRGVVSLPRAPIAVPFRGRCKLWCNGVTHASLARRACARQSCIQEILRERGALPDVLIDLISSFERAG